MNAPAQRRKVTRGFVLGLVAMVTLFGLALVVASWGLLSLWLQVLPVESDVPFIVAPLIVVVAVAQLFWMLWRVALTLLRGRSAPPWAQSFLVALIGYVIWGVLGLIAGLTAQEAWFSVFPLALAISWFISVHIFWLLLARQVYTERPTPLWPWERRELRDRERDQ